MKAVVCRAYGLAGLGLEEVEPPRAGDAEVLLRVRAAAVNALDWHLLRGTPYAARLFFGLRRPRTTRPGRDVAGVVEAVGEKVKRFAPGDAVFGTCRGAFAESALAAETSLTALPAGVPFEQAAALPVAGLTALQGLRDAGRLQPGQRVLIHGAGGGVGTFAVQIARALGAEVTAATRAESVETMRALGAARVLDHEREDFTASGERWDLIFDCFSHHPLPACRRALKPGGRYVAAGGPFPSLTSILVGALARSALSLFGSRKLLSFLARSSPGDLALLGEWVAEGKLSPVVDLRYGIAEVPGAIRDLAAGRARGKIVIVP